MCTQNCVCLLGIAQKLAIFVFETGGNPKLLQSRVSVINQDRRSPFVFLPGRQSQRKPKKQCRPYALWFNYCRQYSDSLSASRGKQAVDQKNNSSTSQKESQHISAHFFSTSKSNSSSNFVILVSNTSNWSAIYSWISLVPGTLGQPQLHDMNLAKRVRRRGAISAKITLIWGQRVALKQQAVSFIHVNLGKVAKRRKLIGLIVFLPSWLSARCCPPWYGQMQNNNLLRRCRNINNLTAKWHREAKWGVKQKRFSLKLIKKDRCSSLAVK